MTKSKRIAVILSAMSFMGFMGITTAGIASAQEPPVANCGILSAVVCQVPIGPFGPFNFNINFPQP